MNKQAMIMVGVLALGVMIGGLIFNDKSRGRYDTHVMPDGTTMTNMDHTSDMNTMMMDMVGNMRGKSGTELERVFIADMIPHHQGAVDMAKLLLQDKTIKPELRTFAENIISAQESEITQMNEWLKNYK
jgi:uncharacterized protein (DUF305 family)